MDCNFFHNPSYLGDIYSFQASFKYIIYLFIYLFIYEILFIPGRYPDLIGKYQRSVKDMVADSFPD